MFKNLVILALLLTGHLQAGTWRTPDQAQFTNTTDASSSSAGGACTISGGAAIAKKLFVGGTSSFTGTATMPSGSISSSAWDTGTSTLTVNGVAFSAKAPLASPTFTGTVTLPSGSVTSSAWSYGTSTFAGSGVATFSGSTASTTNANGTVLNAGGYSSSNATDASSSTNGGSATLAGGLAVAKKAFIGTNLRVGTNSIFNETSEIASIGNTYTTDTDTAAVSVQLKNNVDAASTTAALGMLVDYQRAITNSQTDTAAHHALYLIPTLVVPSTKTLTAAGLQYATMRVNHMGLSGSGTLALAQSAAIYLAANSTVTGTNKYGIYMDAYTGANTNNYGIYIESPSGAGTRNEAIRTNGTAPSYFGGAVTVGGNTTSDSNLGTISSVSNGTYYVGSFTWTFTGAFTSNQAKTITYTKSGRMVTLNIPTTTAACSNATTITTTANMPSGLYPIGDFRSSYVVFDNSGSNVTSSNIIRNANLPVFYATAAGGSFTASGVCGWDRDIMISYLSAN